MGGKDSVTVPFNCSYSVVPGIFMAGCYPGSEVKAEAQQKLEGLLEHGIQHIINLMEPDELYWSGQAFVPYEVHMRSMAEKMGHTITFERMPVKDTSIPSRIEMCTILDRIDQCLAENKTVYLHCWGGRGRTGTVVGCFLARHGFSSGQRVLNLIQELRKSTIDHEKPSPETSQQIDMVLSWVEGE